MMTAVLPAPSAVPLTNADLMVFRRGQLLACAGCRSIVAERWLLAGQPAVRIKIKVRSNDEREYIVPTISVYNCGKCGHAGELVTVPETGGRL